MKFDIDDDSDKKKSKKDLGNQSIYLIVAGFLIVAAIILIVTYMALKSGNSTKQSPPVPVSTPTAKTTKNQLTIYDEKSSERPIAVMIDNSIGDARHAGLLESYLNYEILYKNGATRIMAIYKDREVNLIGPIQAPEQYFLDYAIESDAIYVHYGWGRNAEKDIEKLKIDNVNGLNNPEPFRRDTKSIAPHNVFTRMNYLKS